MTTKGRESSIKDKRGVSPSLPRKSDISQQRRSPNPPSASPSRETKNVPNYLRPTISSSLDPSSSPQTLKKQPSLEKNKPSLNRRRSFDKPPSPSQVPSNRLPNVLSSSSDRHLRGSSSFSSKTNNLLKPKDVGKSHTPPISLHPRASTNVKKESIGISSNKKQTNTTTKTLRSDKRPSIPSSPKHVLQQEPSTKEDQNDMIHEQDTSKAPTADILNLEEGDKQQEDDLLHGEVEFEDNSEIPLCEPPQIASEDQDKSLPLVESEISSQAGVSIDENLEENIGDNHFQGHECRSEHGAENNEHQDGNTTRASDVTDPKIDEENKELKVEEAVETEGVEQDATIPEEKEMIEDNTKEAILPNAEEDDEGSKESKDEDSTKVEQSEKIKKVEELANLVIKSQQGVNHGKKDIAAYNDVIEETVSKLREQRKNKVKALVGAFETVISLESDTQPE